MNRVLKVAGVLAVAGIAISACGSESSSSTPTELKSCAPIGEVCRGVSGDVAYAFIIPQNWNGALMLSTSLVPELDIATAQVPVVPISDTIAADVVGKLLEQGYAVAGVSSSGQPWDLSKAQPLAEEAKKVLAENMGTPQQTLMWGSGTSSVNALMNARDLEWVDGALPLCGNVAGINPNFDLALDAAYGVKGLLVPDLQLTNFASAEQAQAEYDRALSAVNAAAADYLGSGRKQVEFIAAIALVPLKTATSNGIGQREFASAVNENFAQVLQRNFQQRFQLEQQLQGNPSGNVGVKYSDRLSPTTIEAIDGDASGTAAQLLDTMNQAPRVTPDVSARTKAVDTTGELGRIRVPVVTMHTEFDAAAPLVNESWLFTYAFGNHADTARYLNFNVFTPPVVYPQSGVTDHGAGHCNFTSASIVGGVQVLKEWVDLDRFPTKAGNARLFGAESGYAPDFVLQVPPAGPSW